jgi:hypothetical protein
MILKIGLHLGILVSILAQSVFGMNMNSPKSEPLFFDFDDAEGSDVDLNLQRTLRSKLEEDLVSKGFQKHNLKSLTFNQLITMVKEQDQLLE